MGNIPTAGNGFNLDKFLSDISPVSSTPTEQDFSRYDILTCDRGDATEPTMPEDFIMDSFIQGIFNTDHIDFTVQQVDDRLSFRVLSANVDILTNKMEELINRINVDKPDIICIQEVLPKHSLDEIHVETEFKIDGFQMYHAGERMKRGIITYIKDSLPVQQIKTEVSFIEGVWCRIPMKSKSLIIGNIYRSPNSNLDNSKSIFAAITEICQQEADIMVCGDFNMKDINWIDGTTSNSDNSPSKWFMECIENNFLTQHVTESTRFRTGQESSLLDLILTSDESLVSGLQYTDPIGKSDHVCLSFEVRRGDVDQNTGKKGRNYYKGDYSALKKDIAAVDWEEVLTNMDVEEAWNLFQRELTSSIGKHIPISQNANKRRKKWISKDTEESIRLKHRAYRKYKNEPTEENWAEFKKMRNKVTETTRNARVDFENQVAHDFKDNPKAFWSYVKGQTSVRSGVAPLKKDDGSIATKPEDKAEELNRFFASVFTDEDRNHIPTPKPEQMTSVLESIVITDKDIEQEIRGLKPGKSAGPDGIHPKVLIEVSEQISLPLKLIFQKSLHEGVVPQAWKEAEVVPIFKKGQRDNPGNYRPVSLTSVCCKMLERIVRRAIVGHATLNNLLTPAQHGFRPNRSCTTQLLLVTEEWTKWMDEDLPFDCIYLDYRKAFDSVPHERLLTKIHSLGVRGSLHKWIRSFLSGRRQRVRVDNSLSSWRPVTSGIPQGSVLGPTLFLFFINDLPSVTQNEVALFADDSKLYGTVAKVEDRESLQRDLHELGEWSAKWQLPFNEDKCSVIHYGRHNAKHNYILNGKVIGKSDEEKDLGVLFDSSLDFERHITAATKKANSRLGIVRRGFRSLSEKPFSRLYKSLVRPLVEYANTVAHPTHKREADKLEGVQRRASKVPHTLKDLPYEERLKKLGIPTLEYRRKRADVLQTWRIVHQVDDLPEAEFFARAETNRTRGHSLKFQKKHSKTRIRKQAFSQRTVSSWNSLPESVVSAEKINTFKSRLDKWWSDDRDKYSYVSEWEKSPKLTSHERLLNFDDREGH